MFFRIAKCDGTTCSACSLLTSPHQMICFEIQAMIYIVSAENMYVGNLFSFLFSDSTPGHQWFLAFSQVYRRDYIFCKTVLGCSLWSAK